MQRTMPRPRLLSHVRKCLSETPVTVLLGGRQTGKTTLAGMVAQGREDITLIDLEAAAGQRALSSTPELTLSSSRGLVIVDEVQRQPQLFQILRPFANPRGLPPTPGQHRRRPR